MPELTTPIPPFSARSGLPAFRSVLHVNEKGGRFGGTEEYLALLALEHQRRGVRSHLACGLLGTEAPASLASAHVVAGLARREGAADAAADLAALVEQLEPDVVYLHNIFDAAIVDALDRLAVRPTLLWYVHDHYVTCLTELRVRHSGPCAALLGGGCLAAIAQGDCVRRHAERTFGPPELGARAALLRSAARVDAVIVVSEYMQRLLQAHLVGAVDRVHLLPRPIRSPAGRAPRGPAPAPGRPVVTFAGRITPEKGLDVVLEALALRPALGALELRIAGVVEHEGHWAHCQSLIVRAQRANPTLVVNYLGHLSYGEADALFSASDVVVVPSCWPEPLGAVTGEALAAGAAVVASRAGGLDTFVRHGESGLLVEPRDAEGWAAAIEDLVTDPARAQQLAARGAAILEGYTIDAHVTGLDDLVRQVARPR